MYKNLFIDVDGTLVDYQNHLLDSAILAIRLARKNGHRVYICTGRSKAEIYDDIWQIGLDGIIGGNGAYVEDEGQVIMHQTIGLESCRQLVDWLHERDLVFYLECNEGLFASEQFEERAQKAIVAYAQYKQKAHASEMTIRKAFPQMIFGGDLYRSDVNKISYVLSTYKDYLDAQEMFPNFEHGTWGGINQEALFGDIGVKNITKLHAIEVLLTHLEADKSSTIAFGDANVDIPMLKYCHIGVAMGNASDENKECADMVTDDVTKDGLYKAFVKLGLIENVGY